MTHTSLRTPHDHPPAWRRRWPGAAAVAAAVLLLHVGALGLWPMAPGPGWQGETRQPLQVRQIAAPTSAVKAVAAPSAAGRAVARRAERTTAPLDPAPSERDERPATPVEDPTVARADADVASGSDALPGGLAVPVYATRLPAAVTLRYELRRGPDRGPGPGRGHAVLQWQPAGDSFELSLNNEWGGNQSLGSSSRGHLAATGLAPERHTESRRGRDVRAANFQYDSSRITFSGPSIEYPLVPGAQDRLSWMLQLAGIVEANPALQAPGSEIAMFVAGSRGDGEVWVFTVQDRDSIDVPAGPVARPLHLTREPRRPYDTRVEVWLDPARGHLPVRLLQWVRPTGQGVDLLLESVDGR